MCETAELVVKSALDEAPFMLSIVDIDSDAELRSRYNDEVPVVIIGGRKLFWGSVDREQFLRRVKEAR